MGKRSPGWGRLGFTKAKKHEDLFIVTLNELEVGSLPEGSKIDMSIVKNI